MFGYQLASVEKTLAASALPAALRSYGAGPFGLRSIVVASLENFAKAADSGMELRESLHAVLLSAEATQSLSLPRLDATQHQLLGALQVVASVDFFLDWLVGVMTSPEVEGGLQLDGLAPLLSEPPDRLLARMCEIAAAFVNKTVSQQPVAAATSDDLVRTLAAGLLLLKNAVLRLAASGPLSVLSAALAGQSLTVRGSEYRGLMRSVPRKTDDTTLLQIGVEDIVGNAEYLDAALRLAKDVAGFDLETGKNPKKLNPILFGMGRPGCGKTITAHAVGRYFLSYCAERRVPARFLIVRRSDWASSYQNASASNLIRLFEEQVKNFEGVCGIYWPDIDTALASRDSGQLRSEEKQNLGAIFGLFDGTLLPKDGSWFMMCDANTLHMDEAATSRIAQNPIQVRGAVSALDYVRMMRDVCLKDVRSFLPQGDESWDTIGELARSMDLSGRNVESVCGNVRALVQNFEYPDEYFSASLERRNQIVAELSREVTFTDIERELRDFEKFHLEAARQQEERKFQDEVASLVRQLNASRAAAVLDRS